MIMERFVWTKISQDIQAMCQQCLHCITTRGGKKVPRPLGEALHGHKPFDVLTMDYLYVEPVRGTDHQYKYILLLKDDFSGYVRLIPSAEATSRVATEALNQWIADFATPEYLVTDGGSHFTAEIMEELTRLRDVQHHITTAYCPWANGTVERANRTVLNVMRSILNEAQITTHNWPYLCPVVQHVINHTPSRRLNGYAPITVVTGRSPESPLDQIWDPKERQWRRIPPEGFAKYVPMLQEVLDEIHKAVDEAKAQRHASNVRQQRRRLNKSHYESFIVGDYVLNAKPVPGPAQKLIAQWRGPYRVVKMINDQVYELEDPLTERHFNAHSQRIRRYADADLNRTVDLKRHLQHADNQLLVDDLLDCRVDRETQELQIKVLWSGFDEAEATWEPARVIYEDVPELVQKLIRRLGDDHPQVEALREMAPMQKRTNTGKRQTQRKRRTKHLVWVQGIHDVRLLGS
ncbi:hypothetical protein PBRA_009684 [Plasmodiophora brassicae]|uniref:Integrase catalytic domain-containing protein n=1 Tax=Plasmodiophora brassicae TaxID=37360 RepID=A0A0G4IKA6_PLABS|nr:hypothetical protein PBRA_009684 [Plasmodiophora brassicae]